MPARPTPIGTPSDPSAHPASVWAATAADPPRTPPLNGDAQTEVVIIGAGYTGLAAANALAERDCGSIVVDAASAGWGASGRNGGFAVPRYKLGFADLARHYGNDTARLLHRFVHEAVDLVEQTVEGCDIPCHFARAGHLTAAHSRAALDALRADLSWLEREAGDTTPRLLDAAQIRAEIGSACYQGGYLDPRGAVIHPLAYCHGLARTLEAKGVAIHGMTPAETIERTGGGVTVRTARGSIRARTAIVATNAYTPPGLAAGGLERRLVPVTTSVIATAPLGPELSAAVLPGRRAVSDTKHLMHYFRVLPDGGLLFGGRGDVTGRRDDPEIYRGLEAAMRGLFPLLSDAPIAYRWSGKVAVTTDGFPHVGRLGEGLVYAMGYGGRGVALSQLLGRFAARMALGETVHAGPMTDGRFRPIPFHRLRIPAMRMIAGWYAFQDRRAAAKDSQRETT